jgi:predicted alpha/beta-fold hydrolase
LLLILLLTLVGLALLALAVILGIAAWVAHNMTLVKRLPVYGHPSQFDLVYEDVTFPSRRDKVPLKGWYLPAASDQRGIVLVQGQEHHRNSPGIRALQLGRDLVEYGFSVLLFDFRGRASLRASGTPAATGSSGMCWGR